ncbi:MAG TPA: heme-binding domain-containing protein [Vicinamibacterales bacterium]|nr:heme-binding domain-containing protein [Vicinamibacterales bacterium]
MALSAANLIKWVLVVLVVFLVGAQFVPVSRTNPPSDPQQSFAARLHPPGPVAAALDRSCRDCHTNDTVWPWYSRVAPTSWLVASDVSEGRAHLNFSEWGALNNRRASRTLEEICEEIESGAMPDRKYVLMHPQARLAPEEIEAICAWARTTARELAPDGNR